MRYSKYLIPTLKETPSDADTLSARLMLRSGMIRKVASGLYEWLPLGLRVLQKVEQIVREEMNRAGGLEVWLPHVQPKELWEETGRWRYYGNELLRLKDRKGAEFCFAPTAEEVITDLARRHIQSYRDLPLNLYQFGTKFRDEIRPRFGVMRAREFFMKDAYSFHATEEDLERTYRVMFDTYSRIFSHLGLKCRPVEADTGSIGGSVSHEFMVLAETGEEVLAVCSSCGYAANIERAETREPTLNQQEKQQPLKEVATPNKYRVEEVAAFLKVSPQKIIKTVFLMVDQKPVVALVRGDTELNSSKLARLLKGSMVRPATDEEYRTVAGCEVGYAGPRHLKAKVVADTLIPSIINGVSGGDKKDRHVLNINVNRDYSPDMVGDIRTIREGDLCPRCENGITFIRGIEVGHIFKLGTKYSDAMKATFLDEQGKATPMRMGCYGIGVSRIVAAAIEQNNDKWGVRWPLPIAPFEVIITPTNVSEDKTRATAEKIYQDLLARGVNVLLDDRDLRAGIKFKDADLIGVPYRVTVGEQSLARGVVELKSRTAEKSEDILLSEIVARVQHVLRARPAPSQSS